MRSRALLCILLLYLSLGIAYATRTPLWQAPDEPAHFNYIRDLAQGRGLPVLKEGDFDAEYLEKLKVAHFPPDMPIDSLRYESHQPPLYYALATPPFLATESLPLTLQVFSLRILSIFLGLILLALSYTLVRQVFPERPLLSLAVPAFIALLPQHNATSSAISNDTLAEVILSALLLLLLEAMKRQDLHLGPRFVLPLGLLLGLALLTKGTTYIALLLVPLALLLRPAYPWKQRLPFILRDTLLVYLVGLLLSGWWFLRNLMVYGDTDLLGQARHDLVVQGQPLTGTLDLAWARYFLATTFKSFWAQFGWMAVPANDATYTLLGLLSLLAAIGLLLFLARNLSTPHSLFLYQRSALILLGATLLLVLLLMFSYNLRFLQAQGRYLFPAIVPIGLFFLLGLREVVSSRYASLLFILLIGGLLLLNLYALKDLLPAL